MSDIAKRLEKAEKLVLKGKHDQALDEYFGILREEPSNDKVRQQAADVAVSLNRTKEAIALLGPLFDRQVSVGDAARAIITYRKLARLSPPTVERSFLFAQLMEKSSRKEALDAYEVTLLGFLRAGRKTEALSAMERIVALDTTAANYQRQGELASESGDKKDAALAFFRAGELELKKGGNGLKQFERSQKLDPTNVDIAMAYANGLLSRGDTAKVIAILEPLAESAGRDRPELRDALGRALLAANRPADAEPLVWEMFQRGAKNLPELMRVMAALLDLGEDERAIALSRKAEASEAKAGRRREYVLAVRDAFQTRNAGMQFLEYLAELYNSASREQDYCSVLAKLFELYCAAGNFTKAGEALDRMAEVDPYETGHSQRLEKLRGKIDQNLFTSIARRFTVVGVGAGVSSEAQSEKTISDAEKEKEPVVLEDFLLQAEIFLQYSMPSKAIERLERISKLFPYEEEKNPRLRQLYATAQFVPNYEGVPHPGAATPSAPSAPQAPVGPAAAPVPAPPGAATTEESASFDISKVTEITRKIYRQANVKSVLFTTVNEVGRQWEVSRCIAGLCTPGKPPSAALEYCAPGVKQSDVVSIVKLITELQNLIREKNVVVISNVGEAAELASAKSLLSMLAVQAIAAIPLMDGEQQVGILILEQCGRPRAWRKPEIEVLKTIGDQVVQAFLNARLRTLMKSLAVTDEKSGLLKRASYLDVLLSEVKRAEQQKSTTTVMLFNFGKAAAMVKEAGETAVEATMQQLGQVVCTHLRQSDMAVRYDLSTIAIILSDTTSKNSFFVVEKIRRVLAPFNSPGSDRPLSITVGIAEAAMQPGYDPVDIVTEVINRADAALAKAHAEGSNRAQVLAPDLESFAVA